MTFSKWQRFGLSTLTVATLALMSTAAHAENLSMWVRASGANAAQVLVDGWNAKHDDKIEITVIPDNQMVTKLATGVQANDVPDVLSFDLIFMPDFMKAGFLTDLTADLAADPNQAKVAKAFQDLATYDGKKYGTGFTPDVSILLYNKGLFKAAGLDPEKPPTTLAQLQDYATKIHAIGDDTFGYYFSGSCPGCNIFTQAPMMWASGAHVLPTGPGDEPLEGPGVKEVLTMLHDMWAAGVIPESAEADTGANFIATFETGKIGMVGSGGFAVAALKTDHPEIDFGIAPLPGINEGQASSFVGGDVIAIPTGSKHPDIAKQFILWQLTDEAQLEGLAAHNILPSRTDLADNKYFQAEPRYITTAKAVGIGQTPYALHFNDMVNSDSSPWIQMLQAAVFDGDVDGAIATAKDAMKAIANQ
ncbi:sugar ABC transporter substrate-binding protein [Devosia sp.]|uniref:ABC transporter substrate-binding protein n=1 Tax=Devosia sp. TaxID=1871048 RepID=UPI003264CE84